MSIFLKQGKYIYFSSGFNGRHWKESFSMDRRIHFCNGQSKIDYWFTLQGIKSWSSYSVTSCLHSPFLILYSSSHTSKSSKHVMGGLSWSCLLLVDAGWSAVERVLSRGDPASASCAGARGRSSRLTKDDLSSAWWWRRGQVSPASSQDTEVSACQVLDIS